MTGLKIGYVRVSNDARDLTAQRRALAGIGVEETGVYVDLDRLARGHEVAAARP